MCYNNYSKEKEHYIKYLKYKKGGAKMKELKHISVKLNKETEIKKEWLKIMDKMKELENLKIK